MKYAQLFIFLLSLSYSFDLLANLQSAQDLFSKRSGVGTRVDLEIARELTKEKMYFTAVPFIKEYIASGTGGSKETLDNVIDDVITEVGTKQFEIFPSQILDRINSPMIRYVRAKKYFRLGKYQETVQELKYDFSPSQIVHPFALNLEASANAILKNYEKANLLYKECVLESNKNIKSSLSSGRLKQLEVNRDTCIVGSPRALFAGQKFSEAHNDYLDLPKSSSIWPEILFEEAWNSFYMKDYNRTLGKLVTYNAPIFDYYFNPEIEVLKALTYLQLCLWDDAKKVIDDFYQRYEKEAFIINEIISKRTNDFKYFYLLGKSQMEGKISNDSLLSSMLSFIIKDPTYIDMYEQFVTGKEELTKIKTVGDSGFRKTLALNLRESLRLQRELIGSYVRRRLIQFRNQMTKSFEGMSYVKLEILGGKKTDLYSFNASTKRDRGDIAYVSRNEKQYFWTFNGEFWADELGDYVFSLKSECSK